MNYASLEDMQVTDATGNCTVMTDDPDHPLDTYNAETAMNEVLAAEQAAAQAIDACEQEARASLHEAARHARRITGRTNERIALIHQRVRLQIQRHLRTAERTARATDRARDKEDPRVAVISAVVNDLAAHLTGADSSDDTQTD
ncbi:MAG: hypothetical protein OEU51_07990 [Gammaproteobacteria bacterium]|jgi:vacuolar-type H+-ATPase subunit H|nr:hypothetical protein [Gammaproteobacteria bacterium]